MCKHSHLSALYRIGLAIAVFCGIALIGDRAEADRIAVIQVRLPKLANPYCGVPTHMFANLPEQATSLLDKGGAPMIILSSVIVADDPAYAKFLMAHECCHHALGHLRHNEGLGHTGLQPFYYIRPKLRQMELDADSCAVERLKLSSEAEAISIARKHMFDFGDKPTGAYYPTGIERAENIQRIADR